MHTKIYMKHKMVKCFDMVFFLLLIEIHLSRIIFIVFLIFKKKKMKTLNRRSQKFLNLNKCSILNDSSRREWNYFCILSYKSETWTNISLKFNYLIGSEIILKKKMEKSWRSDLVWRERIFNLKILYKTLTFSRKIVENSFEMLVYVSFYSKM